MAASAGGARAEDTARPFLAYLASWTEVKTDDPEATRLARLPGYITHVALGFTRPDLAYDGNLDLSRTGLLFPFSGQVLKGAIATLHQRHPTVRVLVSVGGWGHFGWDARNFEALARLVKDLGADGVDLDYETPDSGCTRTPDGRVACADDARAIAVLADLRRVLPRPYVVSVAGWSVGAYGEGTFATAEPRYGPYVGMMLAVLRSPQARGIDLVSIMAYDAGPTFRPEQAFRAYRHLWKGPLALGIPVMPSESGGPRFTVERTARQFLEVLGDPQGGAMLYAIGLEPPGPPGPDNPDYRSLALTICVSLGLKDCAAPMP
ncbi:hypothetical protein EZH22_04815 [Xanthobacter dioxanivorans]|uniref:GH18 domain-containing protein n=1 Tax=Xanthobacter dioxanivorans TaxID=2528964 RepID=A0A974PRA0_9HYPH|nr:glycosyl hydrolase family 18 protein [Xanthobacter dioxanivorans]QRG07715.1 hypothetical protein EZH22_04815 [Xanthobacter dioxanivorans]